MNRLRRQKTRTFTGLVMSLVVTLFLACQGMAMAGAVEISTIAKSGTHPTAAMPGCPLMKAIAQADAANTLQGDSDCQHVIKAFDGGSTVGLVWAYTPIVLPALTVQTETRTGIPASALPAHDPIVDPPPTLRFHRFLA